MTISSMGGISEDGDPLPPMAKLTKREVTRAVVGMVARLVLGLAFILLMLDFVPKKPGDPVIYPIAIAVVGIAVYVWFFRRQVQGVYKSRYPNLRAIESLILVAAMFLAIFAMVYVMISMNDPSGFTESLDSFNAYYYALTVLATVGFGDIAPNTVSARSVTMLQMALDIAFIAVIIRVMSNAARKAIQHRAQEAVEAEDRAKEQSN
jgi:voltage-gated potassium channel